MHRVRHQQTANPTLTLKGKEAQICGFETVINNKGDNMTNFMISLITEIMINTSIPIIVVGWAITQWAQHKYVRVNKYDNKGE